MKIIRVGTIQTLDRYEHDIRDLTKYHVRKSKTRDTADTIIGMFREGLNRPDKLNGVVIDDNDKAIGFFLSRLDTLFFSSISAQQKQPVILVEHLYCPNSYIESVYKGLRDKLRKETGAGDLFMFTHRNPEAWIRFSEKYNVHFDIYGYILVDKVKED